MANVGRWQAADENFRKQIDHFKAESGLNVTQIAEQCGGISRISMYRYMEHPASMPKRTERYLTMLFEKYGMRYDPTMGEGSPSAG